MCWPGFTGLNTAYMWNRRFNAAIIGSTDRGACEACQSNCIKCLETSAFSSIPALLYLSFFDFHPRQAIPLLIRSYAFSTHAVILSSMKVSYSRMYRHNAVPNHSTSSPGIIFAILSLLRCAHAQTCYWPDGSDIQESQGYWAPCEPGGGTCCRETEACLSNGLCFGGTFGMVSVQYCEDRGWREDVPH